MMGWWGSWKSKFEAQREIIRSYTPWNRLLWVRKVKDTIKESMYAELVWVIEDWWLGEQFEVKVSPLHIRNKITGSDMIFRGMDDPEKVKSVKWVTTVWMEEATEFDKWDFDQIDLRLRWEKDLQIVLTFNPIDEEHWLNTDFWQYGNTDDVETLHSTFLDNRFVGDHYQKVMERLKEQDPRMYEIYAQGKWGKRVEWQIFENLEEIDGIPEWAKFVWRWLDFWFTNDPSAILGIYEWNWWLIIDEELYRTNMTNPEIVNFLKSIGANPSDDITADSSEPKSIEEIFRSWFNIKGVTKWPDSVLFWIQVMKQFKLYVTKRSVNLKKEFSNYVWKKDKDGKVLNVPIDMWNHAIDAVRYRIMTKYWTPKAEPMLYIL